VIELLRAAENTPNISPTLREIGEALGVSAVRVFEIVSVLERKGWVTRERYARRGVRLAAGV
jgi:DNA-binding MarR family transcriptional regulator